MRVVLGLILHMVMPFFFFVFAGGVLYHFLGNTYLSYDTVLTLY